MRLPIWRQLRYVKTTLERSLVRGCDQHVGTVHDSFNFYLHRHFLTELYYLKLLCLNNKKYSVTRYYFVIGNIPICCINKTSWKTWTHSTINALGSSTYSSTTYTERKKTFIFINPCVSNFLPVAGIPIHSLLSVPRERGRYPV